MLTVIGISIDIFISEVNYLYILIVTNLIYLAMEGDLETIMAGLNCGVPSGIGWPILKDVATAFLSCDDQVTVSGMKHYFNPIGGTNLLSFYYFLECWQLRVDSYLEKLCRK